MIFSREYHQRFSRSRFYPVVIGVSAFFLMVSGLVPFEVVLIPAVASTPKRWKRVCIAAVIGSSVGAMALSFIFQTAGWPLLDRLFPALGTSRGWMTAQNWMGQYGAWALIPIAALPIAQAPALAVAGLLQVPDFGVLTAFLCGKSIKYSVISVLVSRGELHFMKKTQS